MGKRDIKGLARLNRGVVKDLETDKRSFKMDRMCGHKNKCEREREMVQRQKVILLRQTHIFDEQCM